MKRSLSIAMSQHRSKSACDRRTSALSRLTYKDAGGLRQTAKTEIQLLPTAYREVLVLRYLDHLSLADLADRLGVTPATVKARLIRAQAQLRHRMAPGATVRRSGRRRFRPSKSSSAPPLSIRSVRIFRALRPSPERWGRRAGSSSPRNPASLHPQLSLCH